MQELDRQREVGTPRCEGERGSGYRHHSSSDRMGEEKRHEQERGKDKVAP